MFHSDSQPNGQGYDPVFWGYQRLVVSEVAKFLDARGVGNDRANELFAVGKDELDKYVELVEVVEPDGSTQLWPCPGYDRLTNRADYVRQQIQWAILEHWQEDRQLAIPPSTRRDMVNRGETPPDHKQHSWQCVFNGDDGLNSEYHEQESNARGKWTVATYNCFDDLETLEVVYSLCRDDLDRAIVDARLDGFPDVVPAAEVAEQLGRSVSAVKERLKQLEQRYYRLLDVRLPKRRTKRLRGRTSLASKPGRRTVSPRRPGLLPRQRMAHQEYEQQVKEKIREANPKPKPSEDSYGQPNIMELETERLYKDEDGQWCYRGDCCPTPQKLRGSLA